VVTGKVCAVTLRHCQVCRWCQVCRGMTVPWRVTKDIVDRTIMGSAAFVPPKSNREKREPYTIEMLASIKLKLTLTAPADAAVWAVCCIAFFGLGRLSELCSKNGNYSKLLHPSHADIRYAQSRNHESVRDSVLLVFSTCSHLTLRSLYSASLTQRSAQTVKISTGLLSSAWNAIQAGLLRITSASTAAHRIAHTSLRTKCCFQKLPRGSARAQIRLRRSSLVGPILLSMTSRRRSTRLQSPPRSSCRRLTCFELGVQPSTYFGMCLSKPSSAWVVGPAIHSNSISASMPKSWLLFSSCTTTG
jgi:hypothetical protein